MDSQKVSIVIPVFNSAEFLEPALESLRVQSYANIAVLIGYRESTDDSLNIINKFCDSDDRFICIQQRGKGIANALNSCLEKVDTKYVARMDADDVAAENRPAFSSLALLVALPPSPHPL